MTARAEYAGSLAAGLVGGGLVVLAAGQPWATGSAQRSGIPPSRSSVAGVDVVPLVGALGVVILAGVVVVVATRSVGRRVSGACVAVAGVAAAVATLTVEPRLVSALQDQLVGGSVLAWDATAWRWLSLAGAVLGCVFGVTAAWRGPSWPVLGGRYESPSAPQPQEDVAADLWRALDRGDDPTR